MPDVAFERICCVEKIILSLFYVSTEVTNLLCVHSRRPARGGVRTMAAYVLHVDSRRHARSIVRTEVAKVLCVDSRRHARRSVRTDLLRGEDNTFSFLRSDGSNKLTLHA